MQNTGSVKVEIEDPTPSTSSRSSTGSRKEKSQIQETVVSVETSTERNIPLKKTLSQRSLGDMSLSYTPTRKNTPDDNNKTKPKDKKHSPAEYQPRLSQYFKDDSNSPRGKAQATVNTPKKPKKVYSSAYCSLCGYGVSEDHPVFRPCDCKIQVHSECLLAQINRHKSIRCIYCDTQYNVCFLGLQPIWKVRGNVQVSIHNG